jgi:hypothetical protein
MSASTEVMHEHPAWCIVQWVQRLAAGPVAAILTQGMGHLVEKVADWSD